MLGPGSPTNYFVPIDPIPPIEDIDAGLFTRPDPIWISYDIGYGQLWFFASDDGGVSFYPLPLGTTGTLLPVVTHAIVEPAPQVVPGRNDPGFITLVVPPLEQREELYPICDYWCLDIHRGVYHAAAA